MPHARLPDSIAAWIQSRTPPRLGAKSSAVLTVVVAQPSRASYATVQEVAALASVNLATVTRAAQALGFEGWTPFQRELRARYLSHLTAPEVADQHEGGMSAAASSLRRDLDSLAAIGRGHYPEQIAELARAIATGRRTIAVGDGSFAALAQALVHNVRLAGYDIEAVLSGGAHLANRMAFLQSDDVVVIFSFWRLYETAIRTAETAHEAGATVILITDAAVPELEFAADHLLTVPAESVAFHPSLVAALAVVQAIIAELATIDPARTRAAVAVAEMHWQRYSLLYRRTTSSGS